MKPIVFEPIDWNNAHWRDALRAEMKQTWGRLVRRPGLALHPALASPPPFALQGDEVQA